jgi:hypothetical protein
MTARIKLALVALVAAFGLMLIVNSAAKADDKKCDSCATIKKVAESMRCEKCKGQDKACDKCQKDSKAIEDKFAKCCKDKECDVCKTIETAKCHDCAAKKAILDSTFCCATCEKAGNAKAADCKYCQDARTKLAARFPACPVCDKDKKDAAK